MKNAKGVEGGVVIISVAWELASFFVSCEVLAQAGISKTEVMFFSTAITAATLLLGAVVYRVSYCCFE